MAPKIKYTQLFINNEFVDAKSGKTFDTYNPHDGSVIAKVAEGDKADVDLAVAAAKAAFHRNSEWRLMDASQRGRILSKFADLLERDADYLGQLETHNNGTVLTMAKFMTGHVAANNVRYLASLSDKIQGSTIPVDGELFSYTLKQPIGVCGLILPWNGPILSFTNKVATALAAGCTAVVKPAEQTPLTALALAALLVEAGLPKGVVNVITGFGTAGSAITHHPDVAKISFTGSGPVGKLIQQAAGVNNLKRVTLELGGKSPLIIMDDADLSAAVPVAAQGVFAHQGQICVAASRLFVQAGIYDKFVEAAVKYAQNIKIGNPTDAATQHGPQADEATMTKILGYIESGKKEGAKLLTGGNRIGQSGFYVEPTVFADVKDDMTIAKEEIFGPVQSILKFNTLEEVIERANNTSFGLSAGIFTTNINNALQFSKHVEAGIVNVNSYLSFGIQTPFGGFKDSGVGRENGLASVDAFLEVKTVAITLPKKF